MQAGAAAARARPQLGPVATFLRTLTERIIELGPAKDAFQTRQCVNLHKLLVLPLYVAILYAGGGPSPFSQRFGPAAAVLLPIHAIYGMLWVFKDVHFPDPVWRHRMSPIGFALIFGWPLGTYYAPMYCLVTASPFCGPRFGAGNEPGWILAGVACFVTGVFYHFVADAHKFYVLKHHQPRALITNGLFAHCRNPNYFGEVMIYTGYAILSMHAFVLPLFATVWMLIFVPNMLAKDTSMSRHAGWHEWADRTGLLVPWVPSLLYDLYVRGLAKVDEKATVEML